MLADPELLKATLFDTVTDTEPLVVHETLGLPDSVTETFVEALRDLSEVGDTDFLGDVEDITVNVIGELEVLVVIVAELLGDLELLGKTVPVLVAEELPDSVTLIHELTDGDPVPDSDICADSDADTVGEPTLEIVNGPVILCDSEFEYDLIGDSDIPPVLEMPPVAVKRLVIV